MKKLLWIFVLVFLFCSKGFSVESLSDGKKGKIKFESIPVVTLNQFLKGETEGKSVQISGKLQFPKEKWTGRLPAVVLLHGGGGVSDNQSVWAAGLRNIGIATFIVDSNSARGCHKKEKTISVCKNAYLHQGLGHIPDAYRALDLLSTHPRIDPNRIGLIGFSVGGKAALYASVKRFQKMWGTPGLEFAAYVPFYPGCKTAFENDEIISDSPIRIFFGELDDFVSADLCKEYVNRLRKTGKDVTITIYPNVGHAFDHKPDSRGTATKTGSGSGVNYRNCRFVEDLNFDRMALGENDKNNKELKTLNTQCLSLFPKRKQLCLISAYHFLKTSNIYGEPMASWFSYIIKEKEKMCKMGNEDKKDHEDETKKKEAKLTLEKEELKIILQKEVKALEEIKSSLSESDKKFAESVEKFIKKEWGEGKWEIGFIKCMSGHATSLPKEVKEAVIKYGPEKAYEKLPNGEDEEIYNEVFQACEKGADTAQKSDSVQEETKSTLSESESDKKFAEVVEKFIQKEWGDGDWEKGFIKCMIGYTTFLSKEVKEAVIKYGPEKAFSNISNQEDEVAYNKVFKACEKDSDAALKVAMENESTSSEYSSEDQLKSSIAKLEEALIETTEHYKNTMMHFMTDSSCAAKTNNTTKYNGKIAMEAKKAVKDFFISTFKITAIQ